MSFLKRRQPRQLQHKFKEAVWPSMGWRRALYYWRHRLFRHGDSTYKVAGGFATGAAVCVTPFIGTHVAQAIFFCWIFDQSMIAGFIGTILGNPATYPFIFWLIYKVGVAVCGLFGLAGFISLPDDIVLSHFMDQPMLFFKYMIAHPQKLLLPLSVGGYLCGAVIWFIVYGLLYYPVRDLRSRYRLQRLRFHHRHPKKKPDGPPP